MDAAVRAQDVALLSALRNQAGDFLFDFVPARGVQEGARTVVKPAPDGGAEVLPEFATF